MWKRTKQLVPYIFLLLLLLSGVQVYNNFLHEELDKQNWDQMKEITEQQIFNFELKLKNDQKTLESYARLIENALVTSNGSIENLLPLLSSITDNNDFDHFLLSDIDGNAIVDQGELVNISDRAYYHEVLKMKGTIITEPINSKIRDVSIIALATPLFDGEEMVGILVGTYDFEYLNRLLLPSFSGYASTYISNVEGDVIAKASRHIKLKNKTNIFDILYKSNIETFDSFQDIVVKIGSNDVGKSIFNYDSQRNYIYYAPMNVNGWYIFTIVPEAIVLQTSEKIINGSIILTSLMLMLLFSFYYYRMYTQRKQQKELELYAYYDELTGLANIRKFEIEVNALRSKYPSKEFILTKFDIHEFKMINEKYGFEVGDLVLQKISLLISENKDETRIVCKLEKDQWLFLDEKSIQNYDRFEQKINDALTGIIGTSYLEIQCGRTFVEGMEPFGTALERANLAHSLCKGYFGLKIVDYDEEVKKKLVRENELINKMSKALELEDIKLYFQPKVCLKQNKVIGLEALARWIDQGTLIYPNEFIPLFEKNGFITRLDYYMFEQACIYLKEQKEPIPISINFSKNHLHDVNLVYHLLETCIKYKVEPKYLEIELTESVFFDTKKHVNDVLHKLHKAGFSCSMDDFGVGYSSLGLLAKIKVDTLKLDRSFFVDFTDRNKAFILIETVIKLAKQLDMKTVAEGVEDEEVVAYLKELECDMIQSYYYSKPVPKEEILKTIHEINQRQ